MDDTNREFKDLCNKMSDEIMQPFVRQKEHVYIDSDLLYNYRLGAVLALTKNAEEYYYVMDHLNEYMKAPTLECAKFFPKLNLTEADLDKVITDPKYYNFINVASPPTNFIDDFDMMIRVLNTINESKEVTKPLTITINQRMIDIHPTFKRGILEVIHNCDPKVVVNFTNFKSWYEVPEKLIEVQDFMCVYDLIEFLREGTSSQKVLSAMPPKLYRCSIVAYKQSDQPDPTEEQFVNLKAMLEIMCDRFSYIAKTLVNVKENTDGERQDK